MNIFNRLLKLYRTNMVKTPLEDFTTEILSGILSSDSILGDLFANQILHLPGNGFQFKTQASFQSEDPAHPDCRVDMIVSSSEITCFVEHKVESREGYIQLERYARVLDRVGATEHTATSLQYCTKYDEDKLITDHSFRQFRWADIYRFLLPYHNSGVINEYLDFLKSHDMSDELDLSLNDLITLQGMNSAVKKLDLYLQRIRRIFVQHFDPSKIKDSKNLDQIRNRSRYIFHSEYIFGDGYAELGAGFDLSDTPKLKVWIWISDKHTKKAEFKAAMSGIELLQADNTWLGANKPLSDFISADRMDEKIEAWFAETFQKFHDFKINHPELDWHI